MANLEYAGIVSVVLAVGESITVPTNEIWVFSPVRNTNQLGYAIYEINDSGTFFQPTGYAKACLPGGIKLKFNNKNSTDVVNLQCIRIKVV